MSDKVIHACVSGDGSIRIVGDDERCKRTEHAVQWNINREPGRQGEQGPPGPQGEPGPPGEPGEGRPAVSFLAFKTTFQPQDTSPVAYDTVVHDDGGNYDPSQGVFDGGQRPCADRPVERLAPSCSVTGSALSFRPASEGAAADFP